MIESQYASRRRSFSVIWMRFLQRIQKNPTGEVWVFEGKEDISYYSPRIESYYGTPPSFGALIAEGKDNSLRLRTEIEQSTSLLPNTKIAFFLDLDFDESITLNGYNTFITPTYSIENLYFEDSSIHRFLIEKLHLLEEDDGLDLELAHKSAIKWRDDISEILAPFCALLVVLKRHQPVSKELVQFLKDRLIGEVVKVERADTEVAAKAISNPQDLCNSRLPSITLLNSEIDEIVRGWEHRFGGKLYKIVRGKYLLPFLHASLATMIEDSNKRENQKIFSKRRPCQQQIRENDIIATLSNYAETPEQLKEFLLNLKTAWS